MIYRINYTETIAYAFDVEADSVDAAKELFADMMEDGQIDFSGGEITNTELEVETLLDIETDVLNKYRK